MANLNDLQLNDEAVPEINPEDMKEQVGARVEALYPGDYRFTLPATFNFEPVETAKGQRVAAIFRNDTLLQTPAGPFAGRLSNMERVVTDFQTKAESLVNDLGFLLKALGHTGSLKTNKEYAAALAAHAGGTFLATVEWGAYCNPQRPIYKDGAKQDDTTGCGARYAQRKYTKRTGQVVNVIPKGEDGKFAREFVCSCGAELQVFPNLTRIRK